MSAISDRGCVPLGSLVMKPGTITNPQYRFNKTQQHTHDNADAAGKRSHDGQSRVRRKIKLDLANVGADGVSAAVGICERDSR